MGSVRTDFADLLAPLPEDIRESLISTVGSAKHEGWEPTREAMEFLIRSALGQLTDEEAMAESLRLASLRSTSTRRSVRIIDPPQPDPVQRLE